MRARARVHRWRRRKHPGTTAQACVHAGSCACTRVVAQAGVHAHVNAMHALVGGVRICTCLGN
eukprot:4874162-Alexandrium_andersonii.AAC.1